MKKKACFAGNERHKGGNKCALSVPTAGLFWISNAEWNRKQTPPTASVSPPPQNRPLKYSYSIMPPAARRRSLSPFFLYSPPEILLFPPSPPFPYSYSFCPGKRGGKKRNGGPEYEKEWIGRVEKEGGKRYLQSQGERKKGRKNGLLLPVFFALWPSPVLCTIPAWNGKRVNGILFWEGISSMQVVVFLVIFLLQWQALLTFCIATSINASKVSINFSNMNKNIQNQFLCICFFTLALLEAFQGGSIGVSRPWAFSIKVYQKKMSKGKKLQ